MDQKQEELLRHLRAQIDEQKREVYMYYAELKLKLPTYLKTLTISELREAGATVDPNICLPKKAEDYLRSYVESKRKNANLVEKLEEIRSLHKSQIVSHYENIKRKIPVELLKKKLNDLDDEDWSFLGIDFARFKESIGRHKRSKY